MGLTSKKGTPFASAHNEEVAKILLEKGACTLEEAERNEKYKALSSQALDVSINFLFLLTNNYQLGIMEAAQVICGFDSTYRVINPINLLQRSKEKRLNMENAASLAALIDHLILEKSRRLEANREELQLIRKEQEELSSALWNLKGLAKILAPLMEEYKTKPSIVAFKEKYSNAKAVQIAEMTQQNVEGFWLCAQLPAEVLVHTPIQANELEDLIDYYLENDLKITSLKARKQYFNQLDLLKHGQFFAMTGKPDGKMFSMPYHKKLCGVCRQDTFAKFQVFLKENECEGTLLDLEVIKQLEIFGEEVIYLTKEDIARHLKVPRGKFKQLKVFIDRWRSIHKNALKTS